MNKSLVLKTLLVTVASFRFIHTQIDSTILNERTHLQALAQTSNSEKLVFAENKVRVGIQVGHWQNSEVPPELHSIKGNTGAQAENGYTELESNYAIATHVAQTLRDQGVTVDILPTTVPIEYTADAFVTIHADGSLKNTTSGYKIASYAKDATGSAALLSTMIETEYGTTTNMSKNHMITSNMTHYYAFSADRFDHAVSRSTPAVIVETGFITNPEDQELLIHNTQIPAEGIAQGILQYLVHTQPELVFAKGKSVYKQT